MMATRLSSSLYSLFSLAPFHSTPASFAKWKDNGVPQQQSHIRYSVRHKRADAKNALKDLLLNGKATSHYLRDEDNLRHSKNSGRSKSQKSSFGKGKQCKSWQKNKRFSEDEHELPGVVFTANFGGQHSFTWSFNTWENSDCQNSTGFEWKDETKSEKHRGRIWNESDIEEDEVNDIDQQSNRITLGLPSSGHLCLEDVKRAFRESALKWHPDKHHGVAQAVAAEKFKLCVDAYNNLSNALKLP